FCSSPSAGCKPKVRPRRPDPDHNKQQKCLRRVAHAFQRAGSATFSRRKRHYPTTGGVAKFAFVAASCKKSAGLPRRGLLSADGMAKAGLIFMIAPLPKSHQEPPPPQEQRPPGSQEQMRPQPI